MRRTGTADATRYDHASRHGFALVSVVTISILLLLLALGLLGLASSTLRSTDGTIAQAEARANARLGLMLALGELQEHLGPDQCVSATAEILDDDEETFLENPHWVGVWRSTRPDGGSWYQRNDLQGGLEDTRVVENWDREEDVMSFLVSGNEEAVGDKGSPPTFSPFDNDTSSDWVTVLGEGSVGQGTIVEADHVTVPKVALVGNDGVPDGAYGYWVGDLGVKANVRIANPFEEVDDSSSLDRGAQQLLEVMIAQETNLGSLNSRGTLLENPITEQERSRLVSDQQLALLQENGKEWREGLWHDVTTWSQGVLSDTRDGGLRKNLSLYFEGRQSGTQRIEDTDLLVGPRNEEHASQLNTDWDLSRYRKTSPSFGLLRDWAQRILPEEGGESDLDAGQLISTSQSSLGDRAAFANDQPVSLENRQTGSLKPVVVESSVYRSISYHPNPAGSRRRYNIRSHFHPRVQLWNPYNVSLKVPPSVMMMQINSRNDFQTRGVRMLGGFTINVTANWLSWGGGTRTPPPVSEASILESDNYNDPYSGMFYFALPEHEIGPGECLFFTPAQAAEYVGRNVLRNELSASVNPDVTRNYYISSSEFSDEPVVSGFDFTIAEQRFFPRLNVPNQGDDFRFMWKDATGVGSLSIIEFDSLPLLQTASCSHQYGGGKEPALASSDLRGWHPVDFTEFEDPILDITPDVRTRQGYRMRWFQENPSNRAVVGSGQELDGAFDTALLANWNVRAAFALRSPWANLIGDVGDGISSGPWFFGAYTRDLPDENTVSWSAQQPFFYEGTYHGNPFGLPQEGLVRNILFEFPREETGLVSLAQLQHAKLSEFIWHPSYAVGNSLADPRLGLQGLDGTAPVLDEGDGQIASLGGWNENAVGWANDSDRSADQDEWARFARFMVQDHPEDENLVYDLSYELNHSLWDEFYLTGGDRSLWSGFLDDEEFLPNGRLLLRKDYQGQGEELFENQTTGAGIVMLDGAFNINSTRVEAWKSLLLSVQGSIKSQEESVPFPRSVYSEEPYEAGVNFPDGDEAWSGFRALSEEEVSRLAFGIVEEVKLRGPFLSLSDFVNRRLRVDADGDQTSLKGTLEAAIERAGLNEEFVQQWPIDNESELGDYAHPDNIDDATRLSQRLKPASKAWGAPGFLTQADLLQPLGPVISARSDTFVIRCYGESRGSSGRVAAQAWGEAVVQRIPDAVEAEGEQPFEVNHPLGRRFVVRHFRWLSPNEV